MDLLRCDGIENIDKFLQPLRKWYKVVPPSQKWVIIPLTIDISPINHSYSTYKPTQLTMGHHPVSIYWDEHHPCTTMDLGTLCHQAWFARESSIQVDDFSRKKIYKPPFRPFSNVQHVSVSSGWWLMEIQFYKFNFLYQSIFLCLMKQEAFISSGWW